MNEKLIDADTLKTDIEVNIADLQSAFLRQAGLTAFYGQRAALAERAAGRQKIALKAIEGKRYKEIKEALLSAGQKPTEAALVAMLDTDPLVIKARSELIELEYYASLGKMAMEAFRQRKDMLVQLSVQDRMDRQGELRTFNA